MEKDAGRCGVASVRVPGASKNDETGREVRQARKEHCIPVSYHLKDDDHFRTAWLLPALQTGLIEMTIPDKQRYRLKPAGSEYLRRIQEA